MFRFVLLVSLIACTCGASLKPLIDDRIVGGDDVRIEDIPWQVSVILEGVGHWCGGSILSPTTILTAAHCVHSEIPSIYSIRAGSAVRIEGGVIVNISQIILHPNYGWATFDYDIAVLKLATPLTYSTGIQPISLADRDLVVPAGTSTLVSGWGHLSEGGVLADILQRVVLPVVDQEACAASYFPFVITDRMICAGFPEGGRDACNADSGGPMVVNKTLVGVVSFGDGCARPNIPGGYARVSTVRDWIDLHSN